MTPGRATSCEDCVLWEPGQTCATCGRVQPDTSRERASGPAVVAIYELDLHMTFVGPMPERENKAAPEATPAQFAAVDAVREVLREHGFTVAHTGHGTRRTGSSVVDLDVLA